MDNLDDAILARDSFLARYSGPTRGLYACDLRILFDWCAKNDISPMDVTRIQLEYFGRYLEEVRKNKTTSVRRRLSTVRTFYALAHADGRIPRNPGLMVRLPRVNYDGSSVEGLDTVSVAALLRQVNMQPADDKALINLMLLGGLRVSEAIHVKIEDFQGFEHGHRVLRFIGKGNKSRICVVAPALWMVLQECAKGRTEGLLIHNRYGGPLTRNRAYNRVKRIATLAGIGHVHPHMLRHTAITAAIDSGATLENAREYSGHADIRSLMRYYHNSHRLDQSAAYQVAGRLASVQ